MSIIDNKKLIFEIKKARKVTLDLVESFLGTHPQWTFIRSKLLQVFGKHGLESLLIEVEKLDKEQNNVVLRASKESYTKKD